MQDLRKPSPSGKSGHPGAKRRIRLLSAAVLCFLVWAGLTVWDQREQLLAKAAQLEEMEDKYQKILELNEGYKLEVTRLNDAEYIEQKIRKDYHYTREGETLFFTPKP